MTSVVVGVSLVQPRPGMVAPRPTADQLAIRVDRSVEIGEAVGHSARLAHLDSGR